MVLCFVTYCHEVLGLSPEHLATWSWAYAERWYRRHEERQTALRHHPDYLGHSLHAEFGGQWYHLHTKVSLEYASLHSFHDIWTYYRESVTKGVYDVYVWRHPEQQDVALIINRLTGQLEQVRGYLNREPTPIPPSLIVHFLAHHHTDVYRVNLNHGSSISSADKLYLHADGGLFEHLSIQGNSMVIDTHGGHIRHLHVFGGQRLEIRNTIVERITLATTLPMLYVYHSHLHDIHGIFHGLSCSASTWNGKPQPDLTPLWWISDVMDDEERFLSHTPLTIDAWDDDDYRIVPLQLLAQQQDAFIHLRHPLLGYYVTYLMPELYYRWKRSPAWNDLRALLKQHAFGEAISTVSQDPYVQRWAHFLRTMPHYGYAEQLQSDTRYQWLLQHAQTVAQRYS